jgi:hypothetical protein
MNCPKCKNPIEDRATICEWCGEKINSNFSQKFEIYHLLRKLIEKGGFMIIHLNEDHNYYIQVSVHLDRKDFWLEAVSNYFIDPRDPQWQLNQNQHNRLIELGWNDAPPDSNYYREESRSCSKESLIEIVQLIEITAKDIYGVREINYDLITLELDE